MSRKKPSYEELLERCAKAEAALASAQSNPEVAGAKGIKILEMAQAQRRAIHIKQTLLAIRNVNRLIVKENDPALLIERICRTLTESMGYYSAWMALMDADSGKVIHTAHADYDVLFEKMHKQLLVGNHPACMDMALSSPDLIVISKITKDCVSCPLIPNHKKCSRFVQRIEYNNRIYGVLAVAVPSRFAQDKEEQSLFSEVISDIAFALNNIEAEQSHAKLLREQAHLLDSMMNAFVVLRGVFDKRGRLTNCRIEYTNKAFNRMHRVTTDKVKDKLFNQVWPNAEETWIDVYREIVKTGEPQNFIRKNRVKDSIHQCIAYCPWDTRDRFCVIIKDITKDKLKEEELKRSQIQLQSLVCNIPGITYRCRHDKTWTFIYINAAHNQIAGYPASDFLHNKVRSFESIIHREDTAAVWKKISAAIRKNQSWEIEYRLIHKDGSVHWVYEKGQAVKHKKEIIHLDGFILDITERKKAEEDLEARESFLNRVIDQSPFATWISDEKGTLQRANPALKRFLNLTDEQLVGKYNVLKDPLIKNQGLLPQVKSVYKEGKTIHFTCDWDGNDIPSLDLKGSNPVSIEATMFPILNPAGKVTHAVINWIDVTARKRAEEALRFQAKVLNQIHDLITVTDMDGYITYVNDAECRLLNMPREELIGRHVDIFGNDPDSSSTQENIVTQVNKHGTWRGDIINYKTDGSRVVLDCRIFTIYDETGKPNSMCGISSDITQRKKTEEALRASEENFRTIFTNAPLGLFRSTVTGRFIEVNPAMASLYGYDGPEQMIEQVTDIATQIYINPDDRNNIIARQLAAKDMTVHQIQSKRRDGSRFLANLHVKAIRGQNNEVLYLEGIIEDITERARAEEEKARFQARLFQAQKMESLGGLAAGMAHEINNPLGIILQTVQNINRRIDPAFTKNQSTARNLNLDLEVMKSYLEAREIYASVATVKQAAQRAAGIVRNMLNFSRSDSTGMRSYDINTILDNSIDIAGKDYDLKKKYDFRKIRIRKEYSRLPQIICADMEIGQVFLNIIKNAAQAMFEHEDSKKNPELVIRTNANDDFVCVEIEDNGPGMDEETKKRVFEPFFTTKPPGQGTGLGLSVSYFIIATHHNGRLLVTTAPDKGSVFRIELPLSPETTGGVVN